jgi:hypothetical protein
MCSTLDRIQTNAAGTNDYGRTKSFNLGTPDGRTETVITPQANKAAWAIGISAGIFTTWDWSTTAYSAKLPILNNWSSFCPFLFLKRLSLINGHT